MIWIITIFSIWFYPVIAFYLVKGTRDKLELRKKIIITVISVSLTAVFGLITGISTTSLEIDAVFVTSFYLLISLGLWTGIQGRLKFIRITCIALSILIFSLGYFMGTIGALGIGFIAGSFESSSIKRYDNGIIYKERPLGNAFTDLKGKEVEIYKTIGWLPIIEWRLTDRKYYTSETYMNPLQVEYIRSAGTFILSLPDSVKIDEKAWGDTLIVQ
jgi:hypothetical protein